MREPINKNQYEVVVTSWDGFHLYDQIFDSLDLANEVAAREGISSDNIVTVEVVNNK